MRERKSETDERERTRRGEGGRKKRNPEGSVYFYLMIQILCRLIPPVTTIRGLAGSANVIVWFLNCLDIVHTTPYGETHGERMYLRGLGHRLEVTRYNMFLSDLSRDAI